MSMQMRMRMWTWTLGAIGVAAGLAACSSSMGNGNSGNSSNPDHESIATIEQPLTLAKVQPLTKVNVKTAGEIDVETDYLPQVVCCENGAAPLEALKAQAVMARTYMVFRYYGEGVGTTAKPLTGTTADQAYFCQQKVSAACRDAVAATKGEITAYSNAKGERFANVSFFVDGPRPSCIAQKSCACPKPSATTSMTPADHPADCACFNFSSQGAANPAYVTYNWANQGTSVTGSTIGDPKNESNRGCASQNIQACLSYAGWTYPDMLRVFYGQDIELRFMDGSEVGVKTSGPGGGPGAPAGGDGGAGADPDGAPGDDGGCSIVANRGRTTTTTDAWFVFAVSLIGAATIKRRSSSLHHRNGPAVRMAGERP